MHTIIERFGRLAERFDVVLVLGSDYTDISTGTELTVNARIAANLGSPVVLVVHGRERTPDEVRAAAERRHRRAPAAPRPPGRRHRQPDGTGADSTAPRPRSARVPISWSPRLPGVSGAVGADGTGPGRGAAGVAACWGPTPWLRSRVAGSDRRRHEPAERARPGCGPTSRCIAPRATAAELLPGLLMAHQSGTFPSAGRDRADRRLPHPGARSGGCSKAYRTTCPSLSDRAGHLHHRRPRCRRCAARCRRPPPARWRSRGGSSPSGVNAEALIEALEVKPSSVVYPADVRLPAQRARPPRAPATDRHAQLLRRPHPGVGPRSCCSAAWPDLILLEPVEIKTRASATGWCWTGSKIVGSADPGPGRSGSPPSTPRCEPTRASTSSRPARR